MKRSVLSTAAVAALLAGTGFAIGQSSTGQGRQDSGPAAQSQGQQGGQQQQQQPQRGGQQQRETTGQGGGQSGQTTGQSGQREQGRDQPQREQSQQRDQQREQPQRGQSQQREEQRDQQRDRPTTGQGQQQQRQEGRQDGRQEGRQDGRQDGRQQDRQESPGTRGTQTEPQRGGTQTETQRGGTQTETRGGGASVTLTTEQKTKIRQTVLTERAPRVDRVDFAVRPGTTVPRTVRVAPLPQEIVEIHPEWRGYMFFVVGDDIVVVEPDSLRIVAVLDV